MANAVALQAVMTMVVVALAAIVGGSNAAQSAAFGGLACVIPNALFALRLALGSRRPGGATIQGFVVGEFMKVGVTLLLLFAVARAYHGLDWLAFIIGIIAVQKSYFLAFVFRRQRSLTSRLARLSARRHEHRESTTANHQRPI